MEQNSFMLSIPRGCIGKSTSWHTLYEKSHDSLDWRTPDPRMSPMHLMTSNLVLDPIYELRNHFSGLMWTTDHLLVPTDTPAEIYEHYKAYGHREIPLDIQHVSNYSGELRPKLKTEVEEILSGIVSYAEVAITVTTNFILHMYGTEQALAYAQYKLFVTLNHFYGYSIERLELELSKQPLVAGPNRQNLLTIFQQTGINVYMPPVTSFNKKASLDEIYLAGDKVQLVVAAKLLEDLVIRKTDTLEKECILSTFVRDTILMTSQSDLEQLMTKHATFVQLPSLGSRGITVRIMGTTRRSVDNTINDLMKLCGTVYCLEMKAHLDQRLTMQVASTGVNLMTTPSGTVLYGLNTTVKESLKVLKSAGISGPSISILMEQPLELMDFILGKKQGKILKVVNGTGTTITIEKFHEYNFRLRLTGEKASSLLDALKLLEDELPAEKSLYIPEVYHKQIIGQGGMSIQLLMRKYNVYMRFTNTTKEKYPNAFGDSRSDNVIIRCPAKNSYQIDSAAQELLGYVDELARNHHIRHVKLSRNHRRMLLAGQSNSLREVEVSSGAAITLPTEETKETQTLQVSGQTEASTETAISMIRQLLEQTDYEFRIPWSTNFLQAVGPGSEFSVRVSVPLFLGMNAQVQAFEKVQLVGDDTTYSQIVVSVHENFEGELFDDISQVITTYLRNYNIDIVDKGKLSTELQIESGRPRKIQYPESTTVQQESLLKKDSTENLLYRSPQQHEAQLSMSLTQSLPLKPALNVSVLENLSDFQGIVPKRTPQGLPSRPPMSSVQWNRNFDETPIKKRVLENQQDLDSERSLGKLSTPRMQMSRYRRRL